MLKELRRKEKSLEEKISKLDDEIHTLDVFIDKNEKYFSKKSSLEALNKIKEYLENIDIERTNNLEELNKIELEKIEECNHEIILNDNDNTLCMICGLNLSKNDELKRTVFKVTVDGYLYPYDFKDTQYEGIIDAIDEGIENNTLIDSLETELKKIQYLDKTKVRRLK